MLENKWDTKRILTVILVGVIVAKIFGPVGLAVMALIYLWRVGTKNDRED